MRQIKQMKMVLAKTAFSLAAGCLMVLACGCSQKKVQEQELELDQIKNLAQLATMECFYHNVAKAEKTAGTGFFGIGEKDRQYWIEYTGVVKVGVDFNDVEISVKDNVITVSLPSAEILNATIDADSYNEDSIYANADSFWNKNKITVDDQKAAINKSQKTMELQMAQNKDVMNLAQRRAEQLIEQYINSLTAPSGQEYQIKFDSEEYVIPENIQKQIEELAKEKEE